MLMRMKMSLTIISDLIPATLTMTMLKICTLVMKMRKQYGVRKSRLINTMSRWSLMSARRERARKGRISSRKMMMKRLAGQFREGDRADLREIDDTMAESKEDISRALTCLREVTMHLDDMALNPRLVRDQKYRVWAAALDHFIMEIRNTISYRGGDPSLFQYNKDVVEMIISRLSQMRLNEVVVEQMEMRLSLEDAVRSLFNLRIIHEKKIRMIGA
jgi:hypothetical protein